MKILPHYPTVLPQYIQILGINFQQNFPTIIMLKTICKTPKKKETEELHYFCFNLFIIKRVYNNYFVSRSNELGRILINIRYITLDEKM